MSKVHGICRQCARRTFLDGANRVCEKCDQKNLASIVRGVLRTLGLVARDQVNAAAIGRLGVR